MSSTTSNVRPRQNTYGWQGSVMEIQTRAEDTGGALGVLEGHFLEEGVRASASRIAPERRHMGSDDVFSAIHRGSPPPAHRSG